MNVSHVVSEKPTGIVVVSCPLSIVISQSLSPFSPGHNVSGVKYPEGFR